MKKLLILSLFLVALTAGAQTMEGFYYFTARSWERADGSLLVAVYTECAPRMDY